jgi:hypothetical protein
MTKYRLGADELVMLTDEYDDYAIDFAYGLRMLQLNIGNASEVFGERMGFEEFVDWLDLLSQPVNEGFEFLSRYIESSEPSDVAVAQEDWGDGQKVDLRELVGLMRYVSESLQSALDDSPGATVVPGLSEEEEERLEEEVWSVVEKVREVGYETYHFLISAQFHGEKLAGPNAAESELLDASRMFGEKPVKSETVQESNQARPPQARTQKAGRLRAARADAHVGSIRRRIERVFGLPEGSVALCGPDGKVLRADAKIATLRRRWEQ